MWPDSEYAAPRGSFEIPVAPPSGDPAAAPSKTVIVACEWLPYIRGALMQLLLQATWSGPGSDLAQQRAFNLIDLFSECPASVIPFSCPYDWAFTDPQGWYATTALGPLGYSPAFVGHFDGAGLGWTQTDTNDCPASTTMLSGIIIDHDYLPNIAVTSVSFEYDLVLGTHNDCGTPFPTGVQLYNSMGSLIGNQSVGFCTATPGHNTFVATFPGGVANVAKVRLFLMCDEGHCPDVPDGSARIFNVTVQGTGLHSC